ncbi:MAG: hypothetical protein AB1453_04790 [Chloroflexota bacterium]
MNCVRLSLVYTDVFLALLTLGMRLPAFASGTAQEDQACANLQLGGQLHGHLPGERHAQEHDRQFQRAGAGGHQPGVPANRQ